MKTNTQFAKKKILSRMQKSAVKLLNLKNIDQLDPVILLFIQSLAEEVYKSAREINDVESRIIEKLSDVLVTDTTDSTSPAHAILHAIPLENDCLLSLDKLQLKVEILDTKWEKGKIKFECPSGIQVIPSEVELTRKDTVIQTTMGRKANEYTSTEIEIICSQAHAGDVITIKNVPSKKGSEEHSVGWLNLFANNKEYSLNIRLVKFLRSEHLETDKAFLNEHLEKIKAYLKTKSLQQAMIVPEIEVVVEIIISEQQWKGEDILKEIDDPEDYSENKI